MSDAKMHFVAHAKLFIYFFSIKPSGGVGKLLWSPTSYIVLVVVYLYLGLLENVLTVTCEFHRHIGRPVMVLHRLVILAVIH